MALVILKPTLDLHPLTLSKSSSDMHQQVIFSNSGVIDKYINSSNQLKRHLQKFVLKSAALD
jgi:hypothetical protein